MCGRFACFSSHEAVRRLFAGADLPALAAAWNLAPTDHVPVVRVGRDGTLRLGLVRWGLVPHWAKDASIGARLINARAETLAVKPAFRDAFRRRRCLVLASGFYEWARSGAGRTPYFIRRADGEPFAMAGLWERWRASPADDWLDTCTIVTTAPNELIRPLHDRMPAIIPPAAHAAWLDRDAFDPERLQALLAPWDGADFVAYPVGSGVNDPRHEGPELIEAQG